MNSSLPMAVPATAHSTPAERFRGQSMAASAAGVREEQIHNERFDW